MPETTPRRSPRAGDPGPGGTNVPETASAANPLHGRRIVLGITGGIAAYKAVEVCRRLVDAAK